MPWTDPEWPGTPYSQPDWPETWLRFEKEYSDAQQRSRLVSHPGVPYVATRSPGHRPTQAELGQVALKYLVRLREFLDERDHEPDYLRYAVDSLSGSIGNGFRWLPLWPEFGASTVPDKAPRLASWNLSRSSDYDVPASVIMVAAEFYGMGDPISPRAGIRVPMTVEADGNTCTVRIRSVTIEFPSGEDAFLTDLAARAGPTSRARMLSAVSTALERFYTSDDVTAVIAEAAGVTQESVTINDIQFHPTELESWRSSPWEFTLRATAHGANPSRVPRPLGYALRSVFRIENIDVSQLDPVLVSTERTPLATHAAPEGQARVFVQTPPGWAAPAGEEYTWSKRRPTRDDGDLDKVRSFFKLGAAAQIHLENDGYRVCVCPRYAPEDAGQTPLSTKVVHLPDGHDLQPRRDAFSAVSAYFNCFRLFEMMKLFGLPPQLFNVRARQDMLVFYRHGISPGPGKSGRTVNAQVMLDCKTQGKPVIRMNLALAELTKWDRPGPRAWAQPLGIATSGRWIAHEFGHYLLAARLGQLEFDFAHSAGDAIAAIMFDPESTLAEPPGNGVATSFRGITYPFVFSTRRHDRIAEMGWAWYGHLNRSVIESPAADPSHTKGYLTEQILSTTLFRLYRALGGDTVQADGRADIPQRRRAADMALFLLFRATAGFAQPPSRAEMFELGLEEAGWMTLPPLPPGPSAAPDPWQGGTTHKVVRWAFEAQGMFPPDPQRMHNAPGDPPPEDIYVSDRRPWTEDTLAGPVQYGPGAYVPVSLDWRADARWQSDPSNLRVGNRGTAQAQNVGLRVWVGSDPLNPPDPITWNAAAIDLPLGNLAAGGSIDLLSLPQVQTLVNGTVAAPGTLGLILFEVTCPNDRANTDPLAQLPPKAEDSGTGLPETPQALTDLVANDNNLGLVVVRP
ncbi:hypothetical protein SAMN05444404_2662 [Ruegeria lacuscaerulensis ITI-1157]|nr:hypothetical protein SAMN05444404_2662 [Ruegeria lacuscaerulensis ITI-1157]